MDQSFENISKTIGKHCQKLKIEYQNFLTALHPKGHTNNIYSYRDALRDYEDIFQNEAVHLNKTAEAAEQRISII